MKKLTWNQFLSACKLAWETEGQGSDEVKIVHSYLLKCEKNSSMGLIQVAAAAYKMYMSN